MSERMMSIAKGLYRHNKTGNIYNVLGVALHTETSEYEVVYCPYVEHNQQQSYKLYVRPFEMFTEIVDINGKYVPRFEKISNTPDQ